MPIFEYVCRDCHREFETLVTAARQPECPACHGRDLEKQFSVFAVSAKSGESTAARRSLGEGGPCGACGDPRGAGSCSLN
jgi:putative FmdB family regulatory protein